MNIKKYNNYIKEELDHSDLDPLGEEEWDDDIIPYEYQTDLIIREPVQKNVYKNIYKVLIENMHGDADAYTNVTIYLNEEDVIKVINFCEWVHEKWLDDRKIRNIYNIVFNNNNIHFMEGDATADCQFLAIPSVRKVTYFDNNGIEYNVRIIKRKIR